MRPAATAIPEAHTTAEDDLLAALAITARKPPPPGQAEFVEALADRLWRRGPSR